MQDVLRGAALTDAEIFDRLRSLISAEFEIEAQRVTLDANLFQDLDLDSIDAVDLAIRLQEITGRRVTPQEFKGIRTVSDVVSAVRRLLGA